MAEHDQRVKAPRHFGKAGKVGKLGKRDPRRKLAETVAKEVKKVTKKAKVHIDTDGDGVADTTVEGTAVEE